MSQVLGRFAIGWGVFLVVPSLVLLFVLDRGTAEFTVTMLTLVMGMFMVLAGVGWMAFVKYHEERLDTRKARDHRAPT
jgi:uncharacterized membrane protein